MWGAKSFFQGYIDNMFLYRECFAPNLMDILCPIEKTIMICDLMQQTLNKQELVIMFPAHVASEQLQERAGEGKPCTSHTFLTEE